MTRELIVAETQWRRLLGITRPRTRRNIAVLNCAVTIGGRPERWLRRVDVLAMLAAEAERLDSPHIRSIHDQLAQCTEAPT